jgi:hypothetical protein
MGASRPEGIRGLQRVAPLHAPATALTATYVHVEATHMRSHDWQIFLNLGGDARLGQSAAAMRTLIGECHVNVFVDRGRRLSMGMPPMSATALTSRPTGLRGRRAFREGCRLTFACAARRLKGFSQSLDLALQSVAFPFEPRVLVAEPIAFVSRVLDLPTQALQLSLGVFDRLRFVA